MLISTRGRYALRVMIHLAEYGEQTGGGYIALKEIAAKQEISQKYIEGIMTMLSKNGLVDGIHGKGGGYRLNRDPKDYKVGEILRLTEGGLAPVSCLEQGAKPCERASECRTLPMWENLNRIINDYLDSVSVANLMSGGSVGE